MKPHTNPRRGRNRGNGKRHTPIRNQTFESNGPEGKIRGTAQQVLDRYLALGRDAFSTGDLVIAESYYQHAEHYYRLLHIEGAERPRPVVAGVDGAAEGEAPETPSEAPTEEVGDRLSA